MIVPEVGPSEAVVTSNKVSIQVLYPRMSYMKCWADRMQVLVHVQNWLLSQVTCLYTCHGHAQRTLAYCLVTDYGASQGMEWQDSPACCWCLWCWCELLTASWVGVCTAPSARLLTASLVGVCKALSARLLTASGAGVCTALSARLCRRVNMVGQRRQAASV